MAQCFLVLREYIEYIEQAVSDIRQEVVLQHEVWAMS
jgi:hypothetical protein